MSDDMNHEHAMSEQATERYLLGLLPENERDAFEEHYFECAVCADDVRATSAFVDTMRASAREANPFLERQKARARRRYTLPLAAAASLIIGVVTMQFGFVAPLQVQLAESRQPYAPLDYPLRAVRGVGPHINAVAAANLNVELPPGSAATRGVYTCTILDAQGHPHGSPVKVSPEQIVDGTLTVAIPPRALPPGEYSLRIDDINPPVEPYSFTVESASDKVR
jgi:hypothetical protein